MNGKMKYNDEYELVIKIRMNDTVEKQKVVDYIKFALEKSKKMKNVDVEAITKIDENYRKITEIIEKELF